MTKFAEKLSVSVPRDLAKAVRKRVGPRGLSGFVALAVQHELEREQLQSFLKELDDELGEVSGQVMREVRKSWRKR